jgi:importin subunit beta-1
MRDQDPTKFLATLTKEIADEGNSEAIRQMACLVCKNFISNKNNDEKYNDFWVGLDHVFKDNVKTAVTATLASPSALVRGQIASLIAAIASIEIPRGEWTDLISNLCTNAGNENLEIRLASLQTIGYICEELTTKDLSKELTD